MKSRTKSMLSNEVIKKLVKVNFGEDSEVRSIQELEGGMFNSAYLIERIGEKDKIVLKVSVSPDAPTLTYEKEPMPTELEVYRMIAEHTNIPIPRILSYDLGKQHISSNYFFMTALEGVTMNKLERKLSKENLEQIKMEIAGYFAQLHQIKGSYFGYFTKDKKLQFTTWKEAFLHMIGMILKDGKMHGVNLPYERFEKLLKEKAHYLDVVKEPVLVDYDLWTGNIFLKKQGEKYVVEGVIDFERAFWGDPYADFPTSPIGLRDIRTEEKFWNTYKEKAKLSKDLTKEIPYLS